MKLEFPNDENGDVLRRMQANGDDLTQPRDIDFSLLFEDETSAAAFCNVFSAKGYPTEFELWEPFSADDENTGKWDVRIVRRMVPDHAAITAFEDELQASASPLGGYNDGWGCVAVDAQGRPLIPAKDQDSGAI